MRNYRLPFIAILAAILFLQGCAAIQPLPQAARGGDTIALAVASQDGMNEFNTQVWFISDADPGNPIDITSGIRSVFDIYPDKGSWAYSPNNPSADTNFRYLHREPAQTVIALDLPTGLLTGMGTIRLQTSLPRVVPLEPGYADVYPDLNNVDVRIEILPGVGSANPFSYKTTYGGTLSGDLGGLRAMRHALVRPPQEDPSGIWSSGYGAVEFKLNLVMTDLSGSGMSESNLRLFTQDVSTWTGSKPQMTWRYGNGVLTVLFISANGNIRYFEPRFGVVAENATFDSTPAIVSVRYFDLNGNQIAGPSASDYAVSLKGVARY